jgi:hypothetical protein
MATETAPYQIRPEATNYLTRHSCELCGGTSGLEKSPTINVFRDEGGERHVVCIDCAFATPDELRHRVLASADELDRAETESAANLRAIAGKVIPADRADYDRLNSQYDAWWEAEGVGLHDMSDRSGECWMGTCHHEIPAKATASQEAVQFPARSDPDECPF